MAKRLFPTWAETNVANIGDGSPNKIDPGLAKQAEGWEVEKPKVQTMNWLQNLFGHFIKSNNQVLYVGTGVELEAGQRVRVDNLSVIANVLLPALPQEGQWVEVGGVGNYSDYKVTVQGNGNAIMVPADTSCELDEDGSVYRFYWNVALGVWKIERTILGGSA